MFFLCQSCQKFAAGLSIFRLSLSGIDGRSWTSRASSSDARYARYLFFNARDVNATDGFNRWFGFPLRS